MDRSPLQEITSPVRNSGYDDRPIFGSVIKVQITHPADPAGWKPRKQKQQHASKKANAGEGNSKAKWSKLTPFSHQSPAANGEGKSPLQDLHNAHMSIARTVNQLDRTVVRAHKLGFAGKLRADQIDRFGSALQEMEALLLEWYRFFDSMAGQSPWPHNHKQVLGSTLPGQSPAIPNPTPSPLTPSGYLSASLWPMQACRLGRKGEGTPLTPPPPPLAFNSPLSPPAKALKVLDLLSPTSSNFSAVDDSLDLPDPLPAGCPEMTLPSPCPSGSVQSKDKDGMASSDPGLGVPMTAGAMLVTNAEGTRRSAGTLAGRDTTQTAKASMDDFRPSPIPDTPAMSSPPQTVEQLRHRSHSIRSHSSLSPFCIIGPSPCHTDIPSLRRRFSSPDLLRLITPPCPPDLVTKYPESFKKWGAVSVDEVSTPLPSTPSLGNSPPATCQAMRPMGSGGSEDSRRLTGDSLSLPSPFRTPGVELKRRMSTGSISPQSWGEGLHFLPSPEGFSAWARARDEPATSQQHADSWQMNVTWRKLLELPTPEMEFPPTTADFSGAVALLGQLGGLRTEDTKRGLAAGAQAAHSGMTDISHQACKEGIPLAGMVVGCSVSGGKDSSLCSLAVDGDGHAWSGCPVNGISNMQASEMEMVAAGLPIRAKQSCPSATMDHPGNGGSAAEEARGKSRSSCGDLEGCHLSDTGSGSHVHKVHVSESDTTDDKATSGSFQSMAIDCSAPHGSHQEVVPPSSKLATNDQPKAGENGMPDCNVPGDRGWDVVRKAEGLDLRVFPSMFQRGEGAEQLQKVYDLFTDRPVGSAASVSPLPESRSARSISPRLAMKEIATKLPRYGEERLGLLLDLLTSRGLLRRAVISHQFCWQRVGV